MIKEFFIESFIHPKKRINHGTDSQKRIDFIDLAKGICIFLIILFHFNFHNFEFPNLKALRMPLYFTLSGLFFKDYGSIKTFLLKKTNNILFPFLCWIFISFLITFLVIKISQNEYLETSLLYSWIGGGDIKVNLPLWFLFCLFISNLIFYPLHKYLKGKWLLIGVISLAIIGNLLRIYEIKLPLWIDSSLTSMVFFYMGFILKSSNILIQSNNYIKILLLSFGCLLISYCIYYFFDESAFDIMVNEINSNPIIAYFNSICFVIGVLLMCKIISWLPIISYLGRYSIIVLCTHQLLINYVPVVISVAIGGYFKNWTWYLPIVVITCWMMIPVCKKFLPYITAQKPLFKITT